MAAVNLFLVERISACGDAQKFESCVQTVIIARLETFDYQKSEQKSRTDEISLNFFFGNVKNPSETLLKDCILWFWENKCPYLEWIEQNRF